MTAKRKDTGTDEAGWDAETVENIYVLNFDDPAYGGLRVRMREPSAGQLEQMLEFGENRTEVTTKTAGKLFDLLADGLVTWNVRRLGEAVPANKAGIRSMGLVFLVRLIDAWQAGHQAHLEATAQGLTGEPIEITSLPMDSPG